MHHLPNTAGETLKTIYTSPPLDKYSYDHFTGYSPPIRVESSGALGVPNEGLVFVVLEVANHQRNLQMPIDDLGGGLNATVTWSQKAVEAGHEGHAHAHGHAHGDGVWW